MAGHFGVPVVFVAGDQAVVDQATELLGKRRNRGGQGRHWRRRAEPAS